MLCNLFHCTFVAYTCRSDGVGRNTCCSHELTIFTLLLRKHTDDIKRKWYHCMLRTWTVTVPFDAKTRKVYASLWHILYRFVLNQYWQNLFNAVTKVREHVQDKETHTTGTSWMSIWLYRGDFILSFIWAHLKQISRFQHLGHGPYVHR